MKLAYLIALLMTPMTISATDPRLAEYLSQFPITEEMPLDRQVLFDTFDERIASSMAIIVPDREMRKAALNIIRLELRYAASTAAAAHYHNDNED